MLYTEKSAPFSNSNVNFSYNFDTQRKQTHWFKHDFNINNFVMYRKSTPFSNSNVYFSYNYDIACRTWQQKNSYNSRTKQTNALV